MSQLPHVRSTTGMLILSSAIARVEQVDKRGAAGALGSVIKFDRDACVTFMALAQCEAGIRMNAAQGFRAETEMWFDAWDRAFNIFLELEKQLGPL